MVGQQLWDQAQQLSDIPPAARGAAGAAGGAGRAASLLEDGFGSRDSYSAAAGGPAAAAAAGPPVCVASVHQLLQLLVVRVEVLELAQNISSKSLENFERNRRLLTALLSCASC